MADVSIKKIKGLVKDTITDVRTHWKKPAEGKYVSYKEMMAYSIGGIGRELVNNLFGYFGLSASNTLMAMLIGIRPIHIYFMTTLLTIINVFSSFLRAKIIDNTRTKWGKFRPYILFSGFPIVAWCVLFLVLPVSEWGYPIKLVTVFVFVLVQSFFSSFYNDTFSELRSVMSPDSNERSKIYSVTSIITSIAPTITGFLIPLIVDKIDGGYLSMVTYRWVIAPIAIFGVLLSPITALGTKERVITSKAYKQKIKVFKEILQICKNKYWWIRNISGWVGFMEGFCTGIFFWLFMFQYENMTTYSILVTINGTAALFAMLLTPYLSKKVGNRNLVLIQNAVNIFAITGMMLTWQLNTFWFFFIFIYLNQFINSFGIVLDPVMHSEVKDYQQYISGKRLDFMFGAAGVIGLPIGMMTGYLQPFLFEYFGYTTNAKILFDPTMRVPLFNVLFILSIVGAILNLLPLSFYDLTDSKHKNLIHVLQLRALFSDYSINSVTNKQIKSTVESINAAKALYTLPEPDLRASVKEYISLRLKGKNQATIDAFKDLFVQRRLKIDIGGAKFLMKEFFKFERDEFCKFKVEIAERIVKYNHTEYLEAGSKLQEEASNMPNKTVAEKKMKSYLNSIAKRLKRVGKLINKGKASKALTYKDNILNDALALPQDTKEQRKEKTVKLRAAEKHLGIYQKIFSVLQEAKEIIEERDNFLKYDEIEGLYDEAVKAIELEKDPNK